VDAPIICLALLFAGVGASALLGWEHREAPHVPGLGQLFTSVELVPDLVGAEMVKPRRLAGEHLLDGLAADSELPRDIGLGEAFPDQAAQQVAALGMKLPG
jgi:hypothetical protein